MPKSTDQSSSELCLDATKDEDRERGSQPLLSPVIVTDIDALIKEQFTLVVWAMSRYPKDLEKLYGHIKNYSMLVNTKIKQMR